MFNLVKVCLSLAFVALLAGCQPVDSLNPLYRDKDVIFDPALIGKWVENGATLEFFQSGENAYDVIFTDDSNPPDRMVLDGRLVNLEGRRFLDLIQKKWVANPASFRMDIQQVKEGSKMATSFLRAGDGAYIEFGPSITPAKTPQMKMQLRVAHWFFRVTSDDHALGLDYIDDEKLGKVLEHKTVQIKHLLVGPARKPGETDNRQLLLTASTADLQKFVLDHANDNQMFADSLKFKRAEK